MSASSVSCLGTTVADQLDNTPGFAFPRKVTTAEALLEIAVHSLNGESIAVLHCASTFTVLELKEQLAYFTGALVRQQQLVYGRAVMRDCDTLAACGVCAPGAALQYVRLKPSGMALLLQERGASADPSQAMDACLVDVADSVMQAEHQLSERHRPQQPELIARAMPLERRAELMSWMVQAFDAFQLDDTILHGAVATLDRYYAKQREEIDNNTLQKVVLGAVCTELKIIQDRPGYWQRVVGHLCQNRMKLSAVLQAEARILSQLDFAVGLPTPLTFLRGLSLRLAGGDETLRQASRLAVFILELTMFDPSLQYGQPAVILAAGALSAALRSVGASRQKREEMIEDVLTYDPTLSSADKLVIACEERLLRFWLDCSEGTCELAEHGYSYLITKYSGELEFASIAETLVSLRRDSSLESSVGCPATSLVMTCGQVNGGFTNLGTSPIACA